MQLSEKEIEQISNQLAEHLKDDVFYQNMFIHGLVKGAIPLHGREERKEPCSCCLINPEGTNEPSNRICTTKNAIGVMTDQEEQDWCSKINLVPDGRCERAWSIHKAAEECKEKYPQDTKAFFGCYAPAFSEITK